MVRLPSRLALLVAAFSVAAASTGCGDKLLGISATILVTPSELAFGPVTIGSPQQIRVSVSNTGSAPLIVGSITVSENPNSDLSVSDLLTTDCNDQPRSGGTTLSPGECARFNVTWSPTAAETAAGAVAVASNDLQNPIVTLPVTGNAASPILQVCVLTAAGAVDPAACSTLPNKIPTVNFGTGLPGQTSTRTLRVLNNGTAALTVSPQPAISSTVGTPSVFSLSGTIPGGTLAPGATADLTLTAKPTTNGTINGELDILSNDLLSPQLAVPLQVFVAGWQLCVDPSAGLAFGGVTLGQSLTKQITFKNCGSTDFTINQFTFAPYSPTTSQFAITSGSLPTAPSTFAVGSTFTLSITYSPTVIQNDKASIDYMLAVGTNAIQDSVPITGNGLAGACGTTGSTNPTANISASYSSSQTGTYTTFSPATTPSPVVPLDWIKLNGAGSTPSTGLTYTWSFTSQPTGSTATFVGGGSTFTGVQAQFQALVSGAYGVSLTVKNGSGCIGTATATITVASKGAVHIELVWNTACGDLDLHYANSPGGSTGSCTSVVGGNDCAYYNTATTWGATLDHDDLDGYGPENVTHASPSNGSYQVWVYYFAADSSGGGATCGTVVPTVNVYFNGTLSKTYTLTNGMAVGQAWNAADVTVSASATQFSSSAGSTSAVSGGSGPCTGN